MEKWVGNIWQGKDAYFLIFFVLLKNWHKSSKSPPFMPPNKVFFLAFFTHVPQWSNFTQFYFNVRCFIIFICLGDFYNLVIQCLSTISVFQLTFHNSKEFSPLLYFICFLIAKKLLMSAKTTILNPVN